MDEFTHIFTTPYDALDSLNGKKCRIARTIKVKNSDGTTSEAYRVVFEDGTEVGAWTEELKEIAP